jgi:hypothetical protein
LRHIPHSKLEVISQARNARCSRCAQIKFSRRSSLGRQKNTAALFLSLWSLSFYGGSPAILEAKINFIFLPGFLTRHSIKCEKKRTPTRSLARCGLHCYVKNVSTNAERARWHLHQEENKNAIKSWRARARRNVWSPPVDVLRPRSSPRRLRVYNLLRASKKYTERRWWKGGQLLDKSWMGNLVCMRFCLSFVAPAFFPSHKRIHILYAHNKNTHQHVYNYKARECWVLVLFCVGLFVSGEFS